MLRCLLADDEPPARSRLARMLAPRDFGLVDIPMTVANSGGTTEYYLSELVTNFSGVPWNAYRFELGFGLGGVLMGHAIHPHDIFVYLMGPIKSLFGRTATRVNPIEVEDCAAASLVMRDGSLATLEARANEFDAKLRPRLLEQGAVECLFKPFSATALHEALNAAFK